MKSLIFLFIAIIATLPFVLLSIPFRCVENPPNTSTMPSGSVACSVAELVQSLCNLRIGKATPMQLANLNQNLLFVATRLPVLWPIRIGLEPEWSMSGNPTALVTQVTQRGLDAFGYDIPFPFSYNGKHIGNHSTTSRGCVQ